MSAKLKYGVGEYDKLLHINEVEKGLACKCKCPECGDDLIARKGDKNQYHFAHSSGIDCESAPETAMHILAKEILNENTEIYLSNQDTFEYEKCKLEKQYGSFRPDAIISNEKESIFVEIVVTNDLSKEKEKAFIKSDNRTLVIDLKAIDRGIEKMELEKEVLANCEIRRIISNEVNEVGTIENSSKGDIFKWCFIIAGIGLILLLIFGKSARSNFHTKRRYSNLRKKKKFGI